MDDQQETKIAPLPQNGNRSVAGSSFVLVMAILLFLISMAVGLDWFLQFIQSAR